MTSSRRTTAKGKGKERRPLVFDTDGRHPWDRQSKEAPAQFEMFELYAEMPALQVPGDPTPRRSAATLARQLGKSVAYVSQCAWAGRWSDRAAQRDAHEAAQRRAKRAADREAMVDTHLALSRRMLAKAATAIQGLDPSDMKPGEIARVVETAAKIQRAALELPDSTVTVTGQGGGPVAVSMVPASEAERLARLGDIAAELARRAGQGDVDPAAYDAFLDKGTGTGQG